MSKPTSGFSIFLLAWETQRNSDLVTSADDKDYYSILLINASNPFDSLKREVMLLISYFALLVFSSYKKKRFLHSIEGITQACSLGIYLYAMTFIPLIKRAWLNKIRQTWFFGDVNCNGCVSQINAFL